ncbi:MAG TPA: hypothetical protein VK053_14555, partial [Jiangellaceae bacterium]|nr:hypothetical protein [Jiangellaceae bacterium]
TEASLREPSSIDVDSAGNVYFLEDSWPAVRMIRPDGTLVTIAGDSYLDEDEGGFAGDGQAALDAELNTPRDVAVGPDDTVYVADTYNGRVRRIDQDGVIDTVAGNGQRTDDGDDGPAVDAAVDEPVSVAVADDGRLHLSSLRSKNIRIVDEAGTITTLAGLSQDGEDQDETDRERDAADVTLHPTDLGVGPDGQLYVTGEGGEFDVISGSTARRVEGINAAGVAAAPDGSYVTIGSGRIDRVYPDGRAVLLAGGGPVAEPTETGQVGTALDLSTAQDVTVGDEGKIYVTTGAAGMLCLMPDGTVDRVVPTAEGQMILDVGPDGELYTALDQGNQVVRVEPDGSTVEVAGNGDPTVYDDDIGDGGDATEATVRGASDVAVADDGTTYISTTDGVRRVDTDGDIMTVYESPTESDGTMTSYDRPGALTVDERGDVYFADGSTNQVRVIVQPAEVSGPFPWGWAALICGLVVAAAGAVLGYLRRHQLSEVLRRLVTR